MAHGGERPAQVHPYDGVPFIDRHVDQHAVAQNAGVVHQHIDAPERVNGRVNQAPGALVVRHIIAVGHRLAAHGPHLVDHLPRRPVRRTGAVDFGPEVVDHDLGALAGELESVLPSDAPAPSGDDHDPTVTDAHVCSFSFFRSCLA